MPADSERRDWYRDVVASYDTIAEEYAGHYFDELSRKPFDCNLLTRFSQLTPEGLTCDIGCGPGHIARFLSDLGLDVLGVDISQAMVEVARRLNPGLVFEQGDMLCLQFPDNTFAGIAAFYSVIHIERSRLPQALEELFRVLARWPTARFLPRRRGRDPSRGVPRSERLLSRVVLWNRRDVGGPGRGWILNRRNIQPCTL